MERATDYNVVLCRDIDNIDTHKHHNLKKKDIEGALNITLDEHF